MSHASPVAGSPMMRPGTGVRHADGVLDTGLLVRGEVRAVVQPPAGVIPQLRPAAAEGSPEPGWSPNSLPAALGEPLGNVSYHVRQLEKATLTELVAVKQRRGALEHYYTLA
jgi:hypothetical protein